MYEILVFYNNAIIRQYWWLFSCMCLFVYSQCFILRHLWYTLTDFHQIFVASSTCLKLLMHFAICENV